MILVDNGSDAEQLRELADWFTANKDRFAEFLFVTASHNLGANGGRNIAFQLATGDAILVLDNDIVLPDDSYWLDALWQRLDDDSRIGIIGPMLVFAAYPDIVQATGAGLTQMGRVGYLRRAEPVAAISPNLIEVIASPSACWLVRREAQQEVGLLSAEYYPAQYEDIDFCVRLILAGWKIKCDCGVMIKHIEHVTTGNLKEHPFARLTVRQAMRFREKWQDVLPQLATLTEEEIYWGPIPRGGV
jgi:GT2 family glycosyltransferase